MKSKNTSSTNVQDALNTALQDADISNQSHAIMIENLDTQTILGAQGIDPSDLEEDRVTVFVPILDKSGSLYRDQDLVRIEYNTMINAIRGSKRAHTILVETWLFDTVTTLLHGFVPVVDAEELNSSNYMADGGTALYDTVLDALTSTTAYVKTLLDQGYRVKVVFNIFTDGEDNSSRISPNAINSVITDLLKQEIYIFGVTAFGSGYALTAAQAMGIPTNCVREYGQTEKDYRTAFSESSDSVIRQSQTQIGASNSFF